MKFKQRKKYLEHYFMLFSIIQFVIVSIVIAVCYYQITAKNIKESMYSEAHDTAVVMGAIIDEEVNLGDYRNGKEDNDYTKLLAQITEICYETKSQYIYYSVPIGTEQRPLVEHLMVAGDTLPQKGQHYVTDGSGKSKEAYTKIQRIYTGESKEELLYLKNENGDVMTAMVPVYHEGQIVAVGSVDIGMAFIMDQVMMNTVYVVSVMAGVFLVFVFIFAILIRKMLLKPIRLLSKDMDDFMNIATDTAPDYTPVEIESYGEFKTMVSSFNLMKKDMESYTEHLKNITAENERIQVELDLAAKIQKTALPISLSHAALNGCFGLSGFMKPAKEVGGDFYDYFMIDKTQLAIVIADVSGKGIPAALMMMKTKTLISDYALKEESSADIFYKVNKALCQNNEESMFVTAFLGIFDTASGLLRYTNAGHNPPIVYENGRFFLLKDNHDFVLGGMDTAKYQTGTIALKEGSRLLLYTDGVTEAFNTKNELFGEVRLIEALKKAERKSPKHTHDLIYEEVCKFSEGTQQSDDITMLMINFGTSERGGFTGNETLENKIVLKAELSQLEAAHCFFEEVLEKLGASAYIKNECALVIEEIFVNVCYYAYEKTGEIELYYKVEPKKEGIVMRFTDSGRPFNPLEKEDPPKVTDVEHQQIGGLGIYMVKNIVDSMEYSYQDEKNRLTVIKNWVKDESGRLS